ncbi:GNAT family N-acetyltransferase [Nocardiopsis sp. MG754419]|uniref:GNAT family N-acetyltransferase n=1 Tax=Nocardiopsis sp. MG754419 TaxID=2259865 RepID=UPI001BAB442D|nr:GNAT family protein [Nocardiopsis sp. MG754419]MBR8742615.1 alanine acetyltransferase [Nocardiopsis sp. MG754419]
MDTIRPVTTDDVEELTALLVRNRDFLAPWEPLRDDDYFTVPTQRALLENVLDEQEAGRRLSLAIVDDTRIVGRIDLSGITRGALQSASIGYWVAADRNGRGFAGRAVAEVAALAFGMLNLHRLQAETLPENAASQRVLERNGFTRFGTAPEYLWIAGRWRDHHLYHRLNPEWRPV